MTTSEKIAYLKGLAEGLGLGRETKAEKLIAAIIDTLDCVARDIEDLEETTFDLGEEIDAISDDLADLENVVYDELDDDCCCGDFDDDCCCRDHGHSHDDDGCCRDHGHSHDDDGCCHGHGHGHDDDGSCCHGHGHGHEDHGSCCGGHKHHGVVMYEVTCPACDKTITIDEDVLNLGSIECPSCGGLLEFDFEGKETTDGSETE